jgi:cytochrome c-type biogenesis protein CcmH
VASTGNRPHADQSGTPLPPMDELVKGLAAKLEQNPDNLPGWLMLGRSYVSLNQPDGALYAYERAYKLAPENPDVLLGYAQALVKSGREELTGRPAELISEAHKRAPQNQTALWMMGLVSFEHQDFAQTVSYWQQLAAQIPAESQEHQQLAEYIEQARSRMAPGSTPTPAGPQPSPAVAETQTAQSVASPTGPEAAGQPAAPAGAALTVKVSLDPALADQVQPEDRVFVFARAVSGPPMPLAAVSKQVRDLPLQLTLDDSMAMMPQMKLSAFPEVLVGARISKTGNAMPQSGDLQGEVSPVNSGQAAVVQVVINSIRP